MSVSALWNGMVAKVDARRAAFVVWWRQTPVYPWRATLVLAVSIGLSAGGIWIAKAPGDAGRGGALAVALSLVILFFSENSGLRTFKLLTITKPKLQKMFDEIRGSAATERPDGDRLADLERRLTEICDAFVGCIEINDRELFWNNVQLAAGSAIGTLAWGFGDWFVRAGPASV